MIAPESPRGCAEGTAATAPRAPAGVVAASSVTGHFPPDVGFLCLPTRARACAPVRPFAAKSGVVVLCDAAHALDRQPELSEVLPGNTDVPGLRDSVPAVGQLVQAEERELLPVAVGHQ